jgi:hypothetical protein
MDLLENKIREIYQQQKREDEKSIPDYTSMLYKEKRQQPSYAFLRMAALVAGILILLSYYFFRTGNTAEEAVRIQPINIHMPTQPLLNKSFDAVYIWNWKAPTDKLTADARKLLKTGS